MSRLRTISDKLDYIAMGKLNVEQMEYICEINQEVNLKDREIERLNNLMNKATDRVYELLDEYDMEIWEDISYIPLADYWQKMVKEINKKYNTSDLKDDYLEKDLLKQYLFSEIDDYD